MADDEKLNKNKSKSHGKSNPIDVTKPGPISGNAMPSKPSPETRSAPTQGGGGTVMPGKKRTITHSEKERQALEKLAEKHSSPKIEKAHEKNNLFKTIVAIILVVLVVALIVIFMIVIGNNTGKEEGDYEIRVSMQIDNKSSLTVISETGREQLKSIDPGDILEISAKVKNANNITGDVNDNKIPPNVYVRYKIYFILDYEERYDVLVPDVNSDFWYRYNAEDEAKQVDGVTYDDGWFYFCGTLSFQQEVKMFNKVLVDGNSLTCDDGGKYGQIQVDVEVIEADINAIKSEGVWSTAPRTWVMNMSKPFEYDK